jgi:hypothetical protein
VAALWRHWIPQRTRGDGRRSSPRCGGRGCGRHDRAGGVDTGAGGRSGEALKARGLSLRSWETTRSRHVHRGLGDSKFPCEGRCAGAANSAVAAAAAAHETALAAAKAFLKAFYASSLLPRPPLPLSLEKAASKSAHETALVARLREI